MGMPIDPTLVTYLSRHGETEFNRENRFCGEADSPLTTTGIAQAHRNGRALRSALRGCAELCIVSSPLKRAFDTAAIIRTEIARSELPIKTDMRLREISFGAWEGLTVAEIKARDPAAWACRVADRWHVPAPGGECYEQVAIRVGDWLKEQRGILLVVTHGAVDRVLRGLYVGLSSEEICALPEPQDEVFLLKDGHIATL